jgi:hypothetical protein
MGELGRLKSMTGTHTRYQFPSFCKRFSETDEDSVQDPKKSDEQIWRHVHKKTPLNKRNQNKRKRTFSMLIFTKN